MAIARFGPFKISDKDGKIASSGVPVTVLTNVSGTPGVAAHVFSDDAGTVEITGQQEAFVPDTTGKTVGSESVTNSVGIILTDSEGNITFTVPEGDYFLSWAGRQNPLAIEVGDTQVAAFAETFEVKAGAISVANNLGTPGLAIPEATSITKITARVGTAPTTTSLVVRVNKNGTAFGSAIIAAAGTSGVLSATPVALTAISAAVSGTAIFTLTLGAGHGVVAGDKVTLTGFTPATYNGTWTVASVTGTTVVLTAAGFVAGTPANATVQGTGTVTHQMPQAVAAGDVLTFDVTQIGSGTAGSDLAVDVLGS